ncbi:MAG: hypothetical protein AB1758_12820, partial [Candidatus Eremiobacterota bacterium]
MKTNSTSLLGQGQSLRSPAAGSSRDEDTGLPTDLTRMGEHRTFSTGLPRDPRVKKPSPGLVRRFLKWTLITGLLAAAVTIGAGTIGFFANQEALSRPPAVRLVEQDPATASKPAQETSRVAQQPSRALLPADSVAVVVPGDTAREVAWEVQNTPQARNFLEKKTVEARKILEQELRSLRVPDGELLLELDLPLPTGDRPLLHIGPVDLPSMGYNALQTESVPLVLRYHAAPITPRLELAVKPFRADQPPRPDSLPSGGVYLGSVQVQLSPEGRSLPFQGSLDLALDLDGKATLEKLERADPSSPFAAKLRERLEQGQRLTLRGSPQNEGFGGLLQDAFQGQTVDFSAEAVMGRKPLVQASYHLWLGPDVTGDGRADLHVSHSEDLSGFQDMSVRILRLQGSGPAPEGHLARLVNGAVEGEFRSGIHKVLPQVTEKLRQIAVEKVSAQLDRGGPWAQGEGNQKLGTAYEHGLDLTVPGFGPGSNPGSVHYSVGPVSVTEGGVVAELRTTSPRGKLEPVVLPFEVGPGQVGVRLPGSELNRRLLDRTEGGSVDWHGLLGQVKQSKGLLQLEFGKDKAGK